MTDKANTAQQRTPPSPYYDEAGRFIHYCWCGKWGDFGFGVKASQGKLGQWYCREHRPVRDKMDAELVTLPVVVGSTGPTLLTKYGNFANMQAAYEREIEQGAAHQRALADMLRNTTLRGNGK
jgi:hypothetical protein